MMLDGKMFYYTNNATIRQLLEILLMLVRETLKNNAELTTDIVHCSFKLKAMERNKGEKSIGDKTYERGNGNNGIKNEYTKKIIPRLISKCLFSLIS
jgi:hypothetical protein